MSLFLKKTENSPLKVKLKKFPLMRHKIEKFSPNGATKNY
jgi:hypothetical protein